MKHTQYLYVIVRHGKLLTLAGRWSEGCSGIKLNPNLRRATREADRVNGRVIPTIGPNGRNKWLS